MIQSLWSDKFINFYPDKLGLKNLFPNAYLVVFFYCWFVYFSWLKKFTRTCIGSSNYISPCERIAPRAKSEATVVKMNYL